MAHQIHQLLLIILLFFYLQSCSSCGEDCPEDYKCVDRSELCQQMKGNCENLFLRKCMRCACPKTCGICGSDSSSNEEEKDTVATTDDGMMTPSSNTTSSTTTKQPSNSTNQTKAATSMLTMAELNNATLDEFKTKLDGLFENSPWVVIEAAVKRPFRSLAHMHTAMMSVINEASEEKKLALVRAHPDLAGKAARAGTLSEQSKQEQTGIGLDKLTDAQFEQFQSLNKAYKDKFHFPFILAMRDQKGGVEGILNAFRQRLNNTEAQELEEALRQIGRIAHYRLADMVQPADDE